MWGEYFFVEALTKVEPPGGDLSMSDRSILAILAFIWFVLAATACAMCRWYWKRRRKGLAFYQFTLGQVLVLTTLAAILVLLYGTLYQDRFGPLEK